MSSLQTPGGSNWHSTQQEDHTINSIVILTTTLTQEFNYIHVLPGTAQV